MTHATPHSNPLSPARDVVFREMPDGAVLVHLGTNAIFELNATGSRVWMLLSEGRSRPEITARLTAEFDVTTATAEAEVASLLGRLADAGLVTL